MQEPQTRFTVDRIEWPASGYWVIARRANARRGNLLYDVTRGVIPINMVHFGYSMLSDCAGDASILHEIATACGLAMTVKERQQQGMKTERIICPLLKYLVKAKLEFFIGYVFGVFGCSTNREFKHWEITVSVPKITA